MRAVLALSIAACVLACSGSHAPTDASVDAGSADADPGDAATTPVDARVALDGGTPGPLEFAPCPGAFDASRVAGVAIECAASRVPRRWDEPGGESVELVIERIPPPDGSPARAQLWMLSGGPGGSSLALALGYAPLVARAIPGVEVLLVDHRGTGLADRLGCGAEDPRSIAGATIADEEIAVCLNEVRARFSPEELAAFSTTSAARDLLAMIDRARRPGVPVIVYGVSYGTTWAQRVLQLAPDAIDAAVLDSICAPGECRRPVTSARRFDEVGRRLLALCDADPACTARFGPDAAARAESALRGMRERCPELDAAIGVEGARQIAGSMLIDLVARQALPAYFARVERCSSDDVAAIRTLAARLAPAVPTDPLRFSRVHFWVVTRSELFDEPPPTYDAYVAGRSTQTFDASPSRLAYDAWAGAPRYPRDPLESAFAETDVPILAMAGTLDPVTTPSDVAPLVAHLTAASQTFVEIERAPHGVLGTSRYVLDDASRTCGLDLLRQVVADPRAPLDVSCRTETAPIDFDDPALGPALFGTSSLW